jgi:serine/threonine protein kinase
MPLSAGDKLGPYEILASIGAGGMGQVYQDARLNRDVAIKVSGAQFSVPEHRKGLWTSMSFSLFWEFGYLMKCGVTGHGDGMALSCRSELSRRTDWEHAVE